MIYMNQLPDELLFLKSTRFWAIVLIGVTAYAKVKGWVGEAELALIGTIAGGYTTVRTIDRSVDKTAGE